ncbi:MAG: helix-turn-helix domain-containing protein [Pseudomonadota bacterium]|nr:helix-turn-helix domain-containing protein [Pseudomonadota bacterium]
MSDSRSQGPVGATPNYYAIIPANVRYSKNIEMGAKLLYGEITSLTHVQGYCWATNGYFAELYGKGITTIKRWIKSLVDEGFILITHEGSKFHDERKIWIATDIQKSFTQARKRATPPGPKTGHPQPENGPHNIKENIKEEKNISPMPPKGGISSKDSMINSSFEDQEIENDLIQGKKKPNPPSSAASPSPLGLELAKLMLQQIKKGLPDTKGSEKDIPRWAKKIDSVIKNRKINPEDIRNILNWVPTHHFWSITIEGPESFAKGFAKMKAQMKLTTPVKVEDREALKNENKDFYWKFKPDIEKPHPAHMKIKTDVVLGRLEDGVIDKNWNGREMIRWDDPKFKEKLPKWFGTTLEEFYRE